MWERCTQNKKASRAYLHNWLILLARPGGFEPPAKSLEGSCSIHLSYGRVTRGNFSSRAAAAGQGQGWGNGGRLWTTAGQHGAYVRAVVFFLGGQAGTESRARRNTDRKAAAPSIRLLSAAHSPHSPPPPSSQHQRTTSIPVAARHPWRPNAKRPGNPSAPTTLAQRIRTNHRASLVGIRSGTHARPCPFGGCLPPRFNRPPAAPASPPPSACNPLPCLTRPVRRPTGGDAPLPHVRLPGALPLLLQARSP